MTTYIRADTTLLSVIQALRWAWLVPGVIDVPRDLRSDMEMFADFPSSFNSLSEEQKSFTLLIHAALVRRQNNGGRRAVLQLMRAGDTDSDDITIPLPWNRHTVVRIVGQAANRVNIPILTSDRYAISDIIGIPQTAATESAPDATGVTVTEYNNWRVLQPENMEQVPEPIRQYAAHSVGSLPRRRANSGANFVYEDGVSRYEAPVELTETQQAMAHLGFQNLDAILNKARTEYREWLRARRGNGIEAAAAEFERKRREHAAETARRFSTFRTANMTQDELIPTLPFVPHGLASSRRWGIEVESGGARGIAAPEGWNRKRDGSLRSAWDGHTEVQDFEPFEEERTENIAWWDCSDSEHHVRYQETWNPTTERYDHSEVEGFVEPDACENCGERTRMVRVEPQTITHRSQPDDCAEFVSPILTSMHSNGLEFLTTEISKQPQNDTAGVHVHVESNDLTDAQIALLVYGYDQIERFIEASYRREVRNYARRQPEDRVLRAARELKRGTAGSWVRNADRYLTVNVQALSAHGTIEFRAMGPVYDYDHLVRWAMFCREMVNVVAGGATYKDFGRIKKWGDLLALFAKYGKEYTRAAVYEMTGETGSAAKLSKEGSTVTAAALNSDLELAILGLRNMAASAGMASVEAQRSLAAAFAHLTEAADIQSRVTPQLVGVTSRTAI